MSEALELFEQGEAYFADEQYSEAHAAYHRALAVAAAPESWFLRATRNIAWCIYEQGNYELASQVLDDLIAQFDDDTDALLMAGKLALAVSDFEKAIGLFIKCIDKNDLRGKRWLHEAMIGNCCPPERTDLFEI